MQCEVQTPTRSHQEEEDLLATEKKETRWQRAEQLLQLDGEVSRFVAVFGGSECARMVGLVILVPLHSIMSSRYSLAYALMREG